RPGAIIGQHGVGSDGGAVEDMVDPRDIERDLHCQIEQPLDHTARWIVRRGWYFMNVAAPRRRIGQDNIGKRSADVDTHEDHCHVTTWSDNQAQYNGCASRFRSPHAGAPPRRAIRVIHAYRLSFGSPLSLVLART